MAEYIDREAVISAITTDGFEHFSGCISSSEVTLLEILRDSICEIPTADVTEVKHGEWIYSAETINTMSGYFCSACKGAIWHAPDVPQAFRHCPNCGAKMDGKEGAVE